MNFLWSLLCIIVGSKRPKVSQSHVCGVRVPSTGDQPVQSSRCRRAHGIGLGVDATLGVTHSSSAREISGKRHRRDQRGMVRALCLPKNVKEMVSHGVPWYRTGHDGSKYISFSIHDKPEYLAYAEVRVPSSCFFSQRVAHPTAFVQGIKQKWYTHLSL